MTETGSGLSWEQFGALFPFHVVCGPELQVEQVGSTLARICTDVSVGTAFGEIFELVRPPGGLDPAAIRRSQHVLHVFRHRRSGMLLRAQALAIHSDRILFLASPWIRDVAELGALGLSLTDFPLHDATPDLLQVMQATANALADTRLLADELTRQRARLRSANEALQASEEKFRTLSEQSPLGVLTFDLEGNVTFVNERLVKALGGSPKNVLGHAWHRLFPSGVAEAALAQLSALPPGSEPLNLEMPLLRPDGSRGWVSVTGTASRNKDGSPSGFLCVTEDITGRRDAEAAIEEAKKREMMVAGQVQETLLHGHAPVGFPGLSIGEFIASSMEVNGDFYEFFVQNDTTVDVLLGDAMGKGLPAALQGAATKARFSRTLARLIYESGGAIPEPASIVARVQRSLGPQFIAMETFTTLMYLRLDLAAGILTWVGCGHPGVLQRSSDGTWRRLEGDNAPLGFTTSQVFSQEQVDFSPGDLFVVYSDGLTESVSPDGDAFGVERVIATVDRRVGDTAAEIASGIKEEVAGFAGPTGTRDDISCLVIRAEPPIIGSECVAADFDATQASLAAAHTFCSHFLRSLGPSAGTPGWTDVLLLAIHEALVNILQHGLGAKGGDRPINVAIGSTAAGVQVLLTYDGVRFRPPAPSRIPDLEGYPEHGFGLALMEGGCDRVEYGTTPDGGQTITLTKYFPVSPEAEERRPEPCP